MTLQQQLLFDIADLTEDEQAFNNRLSRIVSKLFARLIKAEESTSEPFSLASFDIEAIMCCMEDFLSACEDAKEKLGPEHTASVESCTEMLVQLVDSLLQVHDAIVLLGILEELGMDHQASALGILIGERGGLQLEGTATELPSESLPDSAAPAAMDNKTIGLESATHSAPTTPRKLNISNESYSSASRDVATLVAALGSAQNSEERAAALEALRQHKAEFGDQALTEHLSQVSAPFRAFIQNQLSQAEIDATNPQNHDPDAARTMSERLRNLRSRLEATEIAVQTAVTDDGPTAKESRPAEAALSPTKQSSARTSRLPLQSKLSQPSPSKLLPSSSGVASSTSLYERLAASREASQAASGESHASNSMSRAAALRARLEAVKQKSNVND